MKKHFQYCILLSMILLTDEANAATSLSYVYDSNGNLISGDGKYYEYNDANQLARVKYGDHNGPVISEYVYDYTGQRIKKIDNGVTTFYIGKHYETQTDGSNTQQTSYYFANGERVAKKDALGNISYYHSANLGGTNVITDPNGNLVERIRYYPFGEIREGGSEKYQFTGKEKDKLTDFYYFEARYYNSEFKHFTQADVVAPNIYDPQDLNRYAYVRNNPIKLVDPSGHFWKEFFSIASTIKKAFTMYKLANKISTIYTSVKNLTSVTAENKQDTHVSVSSPQTNKSTNSSNSRSNSGQDEPNNEREETKKLVNTVRQLPTKSLNIAGPINVVTGGGFSRSVNKGLDRILMYEDISGYSEQEFNDYIDRLENRQQKLQEVHPLKWEGY